jgi:hypothetical protein
VIAGGKAKAVLTLVRKGRLVQAMSARAGVPDHRLDSVVALLLAPVGASTRVTIGATDRDPVFSPDGRTIAFVPNGSTSSIMLIGERPAWSPDGREQRRMF